MTRYVLDPAHGGDAYAGRSSPNGAVSPDGAREKDLTLRLARSLASRLGGGCTMTRTRDENLSLARRAGVARGQGADVFLSLHTTPSRGRGTRVWVHRNAAPASHELARLLAHSLGGRYGGNDDESVGVAELAVLSPEVHHPATAAAMIEADLWGRGEREIDAFAATLAEAARNFGGGASCGCDGYGSPHGADELYPVYGRGGGYASALGTYVVASGDTLTGIAGRFGTTVDDLVRLNNLPDANRIRIGQTLQVPDRTYTVQRGDTLTAIARRFGVTVDAFVRENSLSDPNAIRVGQVLRLPAGARDSGAPPAPRPTTPTTPTTPAPTTPPATAPGTGSCATRLAQPASFNTPARDLTRDQAREILVWLTTQRTPGGNQEITIYDGNHARAPEFDASCGITWPANPSPATLANNVRLSATMSDVEYVYLDGHGEHHLPVLDNIDVRLAVMIWRLAQTLRTSWGATKIWHLGMGHGNAAHPNDCHNKGRAIDFAGGEGTRGGTRWSYQVQRDWGNAAPVAGRYRLTAPTAAGPSAYQFFLDVFTFATQQAEDKSQTAGQSTTQGPSTLVPTVWSSSPGHGSFIIFPDHPNTSLAHDHQNHIHFQVGRTNVAGFP